MANNKVVYGGTTIMDITDTTAEAADVAAGEVFYAKSGVRTVGTADYMDKVSDPTAGNVLITDINGQAQDSGYPLPTVNDATLTIQKNATTLDTFTANSATNKTVNITVPTAVSELTNDSGFQTAAQVDAKIFEELENFEHLDYEIVQTLPATGDPGVRYLVPVAGQNYYEEWIYVNNQWNDIGPSNDINLSDYYTKLETDDLLLLKADTADIPTQTSQLTNNGDGVSNYVTFADEATDTVAGVVKLNPNESVTLNANGQLDVGGRLGAFSGTTGIFHSKDRAPRQVSDFSFLITDAIGMNLAAPRDFALVTGVNISLTGSHAAGSTTYTVQNTYVNRIACAVLANGGYLSQSEAYSKENQIVPVTSVTIGGAAYTPNSAANSSTPITITTATTANPTSAVSQLRAFGGITGGFCSEYIGQCVGGASGASLIIGQRVVSTAGNVNAIVSADTYNTGNGNALFGRNHISRKNRWFFAGTGHDNTSGASEAGAAVGQYSNINASTLFAVGNGTAHTERSNAFEVTNDGGIVLKAPNGTRYKITVSNTGALTTTAL